jgi:RHS repeat-associated protein
MRFLRNPFAWIRASMVVLAISCGGLWSDSSEELGVTTQALTADNSVPNPGNETSNTAPMGWTAGNFTVTPDGAASYVLPIWASEGLGGLKPDLALRYNSNAATSSPGVGVGWSLNGFPLSRISRCSRTVALDGTAAPLSWSDSTYCFDGERLIAVSEGSGNSVITTFRKERDDATRVLVQGTSLFAPAGFTVHYKNGLIASFGSSAASRIDGNAISWTADGNSTTSAVTYAWLLDSVSDRAGQLPNGVNNTINVTYDKQPRSNGRYPAPLTFVEVVPSRLDYSYISGTARRSIVFGYGGTDRNDSSYSFVSGLGIASTRTLTSITISGPNPADVATLRTYSLVYEVEVAPTSGRDRLHSIQECDQFGLCKPATTFGYEAGSNAFTDISTTGITGVYDSPSIMDYNGDGNDDVISPDHESADPPSAPYTQFYRRETTWTMVNGVRTFNTHDFGALPSPLPHSPNSKIELADLNGDGVLETPVVSDFNPNTVQSFWTWSGDVSDATRQLYHTVQFLGFPRGVGPMSTPLYFADLDGDGAIDLTWVRSLESAGSSNSSGRPAYAHNTFRQTLGLSKVVTYGTPVDIPDTGGSALTTMTGGQAVMQGFIGAFENSARQGILTLRATTSADPSILRLISINPSAQAVSAPVVRTLSTYPRLLMLDVNGDGLTDFIDAGEQVPAGGNNVGGSFAVSHVYLNTGQGFTPQTSGGHSMVPGAGDNGTNYLFNNTSAAHQGLPSDSAMSGILVGDFNQDGLDDIVFAGVDAGSSRAEMRLLRGATHPTDTTSLVPVDKLYTSTGTAIPLSWRNNNASGFSWVATGDFNGDGLIDIVAIPANDAHWPFGTLHYYIHAGKRADQLTSVVQGFGPTVTVAYDTIMNPNVHAISCIPAENVAASTNYTHCTTGKRWVVSGYSIDSDQGTSSGGRVPASHTLSYSGARTEAQRGWLGFETKMDHDNVTDVFHVTHYANTDYRTAMLPDVDVVYSSATARQRFSVSTSYTITPYTGVYGSVGYTVFPTTVGETDAQLATDPALTQPFQDLLFNAGASVINRQKTTNYTYDVYGNVLTVVEQRPVGRTLPTTTTTYTYNAQDPDNWLIGRVTAVTITSTDGRTGSISRQSSCDYFMGTAWPQTCTVEPTTTPPGAPEVTGADTSVTSTTTYGRNSHAQLASEVTTATATSDDPLNGQTLTRRVTTLFDGVDGVYPTLKNTINTGTVTHNIHLAYHPGLGVLAQSSDENNAVTSRTYDGFGRPTGISPPSGANTTISYETPSDTLLNTNTDGPSFAVHAITTGGGETFQIYNYNGRLIDVRSKLSDASFSSILTRYTGVPGQVGAVSLPTRANTTPSFTNFYYDDLGRVLEKLLPDSNSIWSTYSAASGGGWKIDVTNERQKTHHTVIDTAGRTIGFSNDTVTTSYSYGPFDLQTQITPPSLQNTTAGTPRSPIIKLFYDVLGRRTWIQDGDLGKRKTSYNAFGEIVAETDASAAVTKYTRDAIGRVTRRDDGNGDYVDYLWDVATQGVGMLAQSQMHEQGNTYTHAYNSYLAGGFLGSETMTFTNWPTSGATTSYRTSYGYDTGRLSRIDYPMTASGGQNYYLSTFYDFDSIGLVKHVKGGWCNSATTCTPTSTVTYSTKISNDADNQVTYEDFGGFLGGAGSSSYYYDPLRRWMTDADQLICSGSSCDWFQSIHYDHDESGNVKTRTVGSVVEQFSYDDEDMMTSWDRGGHGADLRTPDTSGGGFMLSISDSFNYTPPALLPQFTSTLQPEPSQLAHGISASGGFGLTYDANGNETQSDWMSFSSATYTSFNLPLSLTPTGASAPITYRYDGANQRVLRSAKASGNGPDTAYMGELFEARMEPDGTSTYVFYIPGERGLVGQQTWTQASPSAPLVQQKVLYYLKDMIGSITAITSAINETDGNVEWQSNYAPWGNTTTIADAYHNVRPYTLPDAPSPTITRGFVGLEHEWGPTTTPLLGNGQLINMRGRIYDSSLGRFLTPDPLVSAPLSVNGYDRYAYAFNNPLRFIDPNGFEQQSTDPTTLETTVIISSPCEANGNCHDDTAELTTPSAQVGSLVVNPTGDPGSASGPGSRAGPKPVEPPRPPPPPPASLPSPIAAMLLQQVMDGAPGTPRGFVDLTHYGSGLSGVYHNGGVIPNPEFARFEKGIRDVTGLSDVQKLLDPNVSGGQKIWAGAKLAAMAIPLGGRLLGAAEAVEAEGAFSRVLSFTERDLQKGFMKHGGDFGLSGNWNPSRSADFSRAVNQFINEPAVVEISGTYRGNAVTHFFNPATGVNVIATPSGGYVSGWTLSVEQMQNLFRAGALQ